MYRWIVTLTLLACAGPAFAWHAPGHQTVGTLAAELLRGTPAERRLTQLLGGMSLAQAAVWADCAKGIDPSRDFAYTARGRFADCAPLETEAHIAEMRAYVQRNHRQCQPAPGAEDCHRGYHYVNMAYQRSRYLAGFTGTRPDDIVGATAAAILVLQGRPAPPPFGFSGPREALLVLAHLVGDMHQPLHVGSLYLDREGRRVDPDKTGLDPETFTMGSNNLWLAGAGPVNLHSVWDSVPARFAPAHVDAAWEAAARAVPPEPGRPLDWPARWATQSLEQARQAFDGLTFSPWQAGRWAVHLPPGYEARAEAIKQRQLTLAGARLAQLLQAALAAQPLQ